MSEINALSPRAPVNSYLIKTSANSLNDDASNIPLMGSSYSGSVSSSPYKNSMNKDIRESKQFNDSKIKSLYEDSLVSNSLNYPASSSVANDISNSLSTSEIPKIIITNNENKPTTPCQSADVSTDQTLKSNTSDSYALSDPSNAAVSDSSKTSESDKPSSFETNLPTYTPLESSMPAEYNPDPAFLPKEYIPPKYDFNKDILDKKHC